MMSTTRISFSVAVIFKQLISRTACCLVLTASVIATAEQPEVDYSPYADRQFPENLYWGDTHVHTNLSTDAYTFENKDRSMEFAYRFAKGKTVISSSGQPVRLSRPLDFIVLTDHAEYLGIFPALASKNSDIVDTNIGRHWRSLFDKGDYAKAFEEVMEVKLDEKNIKQDRPFLTSVWHQVTAEADRANEPGKFTAFIGYEWTSMPTGNNLHRNIVFRDSATKANQVVPFSAIDSHDPEDLWNYLASYESKTGGRVLAIPHNGNTSNGTMFPDKNAMGDPLSKSYAETRMRWEPIYEVTQIKGDGESHPYLSPEDDFADFENWDEGNFGNPVLKKEKWMLQHEYARGALKLGLKQEARLGVNPFKFGMIGSSDAHTSLAAVEENNFFGKYPTDEPNSKRSHLLIPLDVTKYGASGYAAVWATENTREAIFDAMQRKETYATTGSRIMVRFFGGWDFARDDHQRPDFVAHGYLKGVPMGGDLISAPKNQSPRFLIVASKDPLGANLDRIQVIKGWLDADGAVQEKIYNVGLSDGRKVNRKGQVQALKSTVDIETATYKNSIGAIQLATVWEDPDFNPEQRAFYYVRVLEIPTPRWTTYDAAFFGIKPPESIPAVIQERAYTSPIWYTP